MKIKQLLLAIVSAFIADLATAQIFSGGNLDISPIGPTSPNKPNLDLGDLKPVINPNNPIPQIINWAYLRTQHKTTFGDANPSTTYYSSENSHLLLAPTNNQYLLKFGPRYNPTPSSPNPTPSKPIRKPSYSPLTYVTTSDPRYTFSNFENPKSFLNLGTLNSTFYSFYIDEIQPWASLDRMKSTNDAENAYERQNIINAASLVNAELMSQYFLKNNPTSYKFGDAARMIDPQYHILSADEWRNIITRSGSDVNMDHVGEKNYFYRPIPSVFFVFATFDDPIYFGGNIINLDPITIFIGVAIFPDGNNKELLDEINGLEGVTVEYDKIDTKRKVTSNDSEMEVTCSLNKISIDVKSNPIIKTTNLDLFLKLSDKFTFLPTYRYMLMRIDEQPIYQTAVSPGFADCDGVVRALPDYVILWTSTGGADGKAKAIVFGEFDPSKGKIPSNMIAYQKHPENYQTFTANNLFGLGDYMGYYYKIVDIDKKWGLPVHAAKTLNEPPLKRIANSLGSFSAETRLQTLYKGTSYVNKELITLQDKIASSFTGKYAGRPIAEMPVNDRKELIEGLEKDDALPRLEQIPGKYQGTFDASEAEIDNVLAKVNNTLFQKIDKGGVVKDLYFKNSVLYLTDEYGSFSSVTVTEDSVKINLIADEVNGELDGFGFSGEVIISDSIQDKYPDKTIQVYLIGKVTEGAKVRGVLAQPEQSSNKTLSLHQIAPMQYGDENGGIGNCKLAATFNEFDSKAGSLYYNRPALEEFVYTSQELKKNVRYFTLDEFAEGAASYWLNWSGPGYTGTYEPKWTVDEDGLPVKAKGGDKAIYRVDYYYEQEDVNKVTHADKFAKSGEDIIIKYNEKPAKILVNDKPLTGIGEKEARFQLTKDTKVKLEFNKSAEIDDPENSAVTALNANEANQVTVTAGNFKVEIGGVTAGAATVYDVAGNVVARTTAKSIDVPKRGIYIVRVDGKSYKVTVK